MRIRGKRCFIIQHGMILWGITTAILVIVLRMMLERRAVFYFEFIVTLLCLIISGYFYGLWVWHSNEKSTKNMRTSRILKSISRVGVRHCKSVDKEGVKRIE